MFAEIAFLLYVGHLLADYPFQTDHQAAHKAGCGRTGWTANVAHATTHVLTCGLLLTIGSVALGWDLPLWAAVLAVLWIGVSHGFIDRRWPVAAWMRIARQSGWAAHGGAAHVDQTAHVLALTLAALALSV
ncbi:DUF3307 domain-containing protein [Streptomyces goshikiensis]|uniref:DUF3307 domain-containing protein n=1 Tax=Streptomyces goshikiensis TaxID=1942 RepID=UPI0016743C81|nr:DUF3307 domain-containing protein [Streptomyces goshikiensis]GHD59299.1 hypothetical protein GCM10010336_09770 [Streptomyces goshikiensis]